MFVQDVQMVDNDVMASNGVMHVIDEVIVPEDGELVQVKNCLTTLLTA